MGLGRNQVLLLRQNQSLSGLSNRATTRDSERDARGQARAGGPRRIPSATASRSRGR